MAAPTCQAIGRAILRDWGILYLDPTDPAGQTNLCRALDVEAAALAMTQAFQLIARKSGSESKTQPGSGVLRAPTAVTLTATDGSTTISALTTYAAWQLGCTIRIAGDDQDNELISSTKLARPFIGTGGANIAATIYGDAITLDDTTGKVLAPMLLAHGEMLEQATNRHDFLTLGGYRLPAYYGEGYANYPFYNLAQKPLETQPSIFFVDGYYDSSLDYITRRIRFSPMPSVRQSVGWTATINPQRVTAADIDGEDHADPGRKIPCVNGWIESIFLPIARQLGTGQPQFKNDDLRAEIGRQYAEAISALSSATGSATAAKTFYI